MEFRAKVVELARAGRRPEDLATEFELSNQTIRNWIKQADLDAGKRTDGLTSEERTELFMLRRKVKQLTNRVETIHRRSRNTYGRPRIKAELKDEGISISNDRLARLTNERHLQGASRRKGIRTTVRDRDARPAPDLVDRKFVADAPNKLWVADITYVPTYAGFLFLAVVLDAFSRRVVGWATASNMRTQLVLDALNHAIWRRQPVDVVHHSDQGTQYTSIAFGSRCREANIRPSMGSVGDCYDNAMCESFNATLECELLDKHRFRTHKEAELAIFDFIEGWYNLHRRHSALDYRSPAAFERETAA